MNRKKSYFSRIASSIGKEFNENPIRTMFAIGLWFVLTFGTIGVLAYIMIGGSFSGNIKTDYFEGGINAGQLIKEKQ